MARWIKYQIVCNEEKGILLDKKLGYSDANLIIAQNEAYNGEYEIIDDGKTYQKKPLDIADGGTGSTNVYEARQKLYIEKGTRLAATHITLKNVIKQAPDNSIILLKNTGDYGLLTLKGVDAFNKNITIMPYDDTHVINMAGVCITSGVTDKQINSSYKGNNKYECCNCDTNNAVMSEGLTFKNINFTDSFSLRNCQVDNLSIIGCNFAENCYVSIVPNRLQDKYGNDYDGSKNFETRRTYAKLVPKNLVIKECTFEGVTGTEQSASGDACILVKGVDGVNIYQNTIKKASYSGITVSGVANIEHLVYSIGKIAITNNTISNTGATSINMYDIKNAEITVAANTLSNANLTHGHDGYITLTNSYNCIMVWYGKVDDKTNNHKFPNSYSDSSVTISALSVGNGITLRNVTESHSKEIKTIKENLSYLEENVDFHFSNQDNPHNVSAEQIGAAPQGKLDELFEALSDHLEDPENPHGIDAIKLGINDYVIAAGDVAFNDVTWYYRKWSSGFAECWCSIYRNEVTDYSFDVSLPFNMQSINYDTIPTFHFDFQHAYDFMSVSGVSEIAQNTFRVNLVFPNINYSDEYFSYVAHLYVTGYYQ